MTALVRQKLLTVKEVAAWLQLTSEFVYRESRAGRLTSVRFGRSVRFREEDVERYISQRLTESH